MAALQDCCSATTEDEIGLTSHVSSETRFLQQRDPPGEMEKHLAWDPFICRLEL